MLKENFADEILDSSTARGKKRRISEINSIIIHTTGYGAGLKRIAERNNNLEDVGKAYAHRMANVLKYKGHFLIDHVGKVWQFIPVTEVAWHTGSGKKKLLRSEKLYPWWIERWPDLENPIKLPVWNGSPNVNSVGIDLLAHGNGAITSGYTQAQYKSLSRLIKSLCVYLDIPLERKYILGHEDVDPISRGSKKGGWDPGHFDWGYLFSLMEGEKMIAPSDVQKDTEKIADVAAKSAVNQLWLFLKGFMRGG